MAKVKKINGKGYLKDADGNFIDSQWFENDPDGNIEWKTISEKELIEEIERLGVGETNADINNSKSNS